MTNRLEIAIVQIHMILKPVDPLGQNRYSPCFYGSCFKFSPNHKKGEELIPAPMIDMFVLQRHFRSDSQTYMGDIFNLDCVVLPVQLVPRFVSNDRRLTRDTSLHLSTSFFLNNFASKENFHAILSYQ